MKNETQTEQKKKYTAPTMEVVKINNQTNLLCSSDPSDPTYCSEIN